MTKMEMSKSDRCHTQRLDGPAIKGPALRHENQERDEQITGEGRDENSVEIDLLEHGKKGQAIVKRRGCARERCLFPAATRPRAPRPGAADFRSPDRARRSAGTCRAPPHPPPRDDAGNRRRPQRPAAHAPPPPPATRREPASRAAAAARCPASARSGPRRAIRQSVVPERFCGSFSRVTRSYMRVSQSAKAGIGSRLAIMPSPRRMR